MLPEDKQVKRHLAKEIHARQEKGQLNFQVQIKMEFIINYDHFLENPFLFMIIILLYKR